MVIKANHLPEREADMIQACPDAHDRDAGERSPDVITKKQRPS